MEGRNRIHLREMQLGRRSSQIPLLPTSLIDHHHRNSHHHHHQNFHQHPAVIEEQLHHQRHEIQNLLLDNQRLAATHVALKQELSASKQEIRHISTVASHVKTERDIEIRELYQQSLKLESEVISIGKFSAELAQAKVDIQKLNANKLELTSKLETINGDLVRARQEREESKSVESDIDAMRIEVQMGRDAIEFEKKAYADNLEHKQLLEKKMNELTHTIEKLRSEFVDAEKRADAANAANASVVVPPEPGPVYGGSYGNPQMGYEGAGPSYGNPVGAGPSYVDPVGAQAANAANPGPVYAESYGNPQMGYVGVGPSYGDPYSMHQMVQPNVDARFQYGSAAVTYAPYGIQQSQAYR